MPNPHDQEDGARVGAAPAPLAARDPPCPSWMLEARGIDKRFGPLWANRDVDLRVAKGSIHGIIGENGAGKSTFMRILYGLYQADSGELFVGGQPCMLQSPKDAISAGIGMVHQHFMLIEPFSVLENMLLGAPDDFRGGLVLTRKLNAARERLLTLAQSFGFAVNPEARVADLAVGDRQRVEVLKALFRNCQILILDEPTAVLTPQETDQLFSTLRRLQATGVTIIIITHKLREIMALSDHVSVMRQGAMIGHYETAAVTPEQLGALMVGAPLPQPLTAAARAAPAAALLPPVVVSSPTAEENQPADPAPSTPPSTPAARARLPAAGTRLPAAGTRLKVSELWVCDDHGHPRVRGLSFDLKAGEIVGLAGVSDNGQSELLEALAGMRPISGGGLSFDDLIVDAQHPATPAQLRAAAVAHVPEDRHRHALVLAFSATENAILGYQAAPALNSGIILRRARAATTCAQLMQDFDVRPPWPQQRAGLFSGGNQQKLIIARETTQAPRLLLVGQPTRGVDIGAIAFIHRHLLKLRAQGCAILLVSSELEELITLSDRILVIANGTITANFSGAARKEHLIGLAMAGGAGPEATAPPPTQTSRGSENAPPPSPLD